MCIRDRNATQPLDEHEQLVDFCVQYNKGRMKIIAGVGSNDTIDVYKRQGWITAKYR